MLLEPLKGNLPQNVTDREASIQIDYHLDLIGGQLFRLGKKDILKFVQTVVEPCSQATALAYWCDHGGWQQLRYKLSTSLEPAWSSQNEKYDEQLAMFQDLERLFRVVQAGIVSTPGELERYIVKSLELAVGQASHLTAC